MPYFSCPMRPEYAPRRPLNALDPFLQAFLSELQQQPEPQPQASTTTTPPTSHTTTTPPRPTPRNRNRTNPAFTPRFDVYETSDSYHLEGDLPGVHDKKSISLEFSDERTLLIRGRVPRVPSPTLVKKPTPSEEHDAESEKRRRSLNPTVEEVVDEGDEWTAVQHAPKVGEVVKTIVESDSESEERAKEEEGRKDWLSERTFGRFQRTFSFPSPVRLEGVQARLEDGVLSVVVPKMKFEGVRRIEVE